MDHQSPPTFHHFVYDSRDRSSIFALILLSRQGDKKFFRHKVIHWIAHLVCHFLHRPYIFALLGHNHRFKENSEKFGEKWELSFEARVEVNVDFDVVFLRDLRSDGLLLHLRNFYQASIVSAQRSVLPDEQHFQNNCFVLLLRSLTNRSPLHYAFESLARVHQAKQRIRTFKTTADRKEENLNFSGCYKLESRRCDNESHC